MKINLKNKRILPAVVSTLMVCTTFGLTACTSSTTKTNKDEESKVEETAKVKESELESLAAVLPKYTDV